MKDIPIIFPIALVVIVVLTFFTGVYAVSEGAERDDVPILSASASGTGSLIGSLETDQALEHDWYENAAVWICPLH
jgi:hypothetical protein